MAGTLNTRRLICRGSVALLLTAALAVPTWAQDSGEAPQPSAGAVIKGKAPVAKELLKVRFPKPKSFRLSNGVVVYALVNHRVPAVRFNLTMRAGSLYETKPGVADMAASMLTEGTQSRDYLQLAEATEGIGASLNAGSGQDTASISASGLTEQTDTLISLMADVLLHPTFPADRLERIKFQQTSQVAQRRSNPTGMVGEVAMKVFYGGTPYSRPSPTSEQISAITRDDLVAFHAAYYHPNGAILGVTGDVDLGTLKTKLEAAVADWKPAAQTVELPKADFVAKEATKVYLVDRPGSAQTVLSFGNLTVRRSDPDYIPLVVANAILGGGSAGRLFQNIREQKGYTYGAYSSLSAGLWPGTWSASASVRTAVTEPAAKEFLKEFDRLQDEPVPAEELGRVKRAMIGSFALTLESPEGILGRTIELLRNNLPMNYWDTYPARIQAVTAEDVQRVARKYLGKGRVQIFAVGERSQIESGLSKCGPVEIVDPSQLGGGRGDRRGGR